MRADPRGPAHRPRPEPLRLHDGDRNLQEQVRNDTGVPTSEVLLSQRLRQAGYATAAVGKWHLGVRPPYRPLRRGFDSFFGFLAGTHAYFDWGPGLYGPVFRDDRRVRGEGYLTDAFAEEAEQIIEGAGDAPFFLYVAFHAVHAPFEAPERHRDTYAHLEPPERAAVAAMTAALDDGVGRILDALDRTGRADDTLVWFLNDNGGLPPVSSNAPLRGGKGDLFEGGIRVPFVLRWPARLAPGTSDLPVSVLDVFPTVAAAAGLPEGDRPLDGADLLPSLAGGPPPARPALHWRYDASRAIRRGPWKLLERDGEALLFDLAQDPGETRDLAAEHPRRVAELSRDLDAWESEVAERP
ncbi:MAG: sulfatase-like hydrolase/transferase [Myxococcota bacterium]